MSCVDCFSWLRLQQICSRISLNWLKRILLPREPKHFGCCLKTTGSWHIFDAAMPDLKLELEAIRDVVSQTGFKVANIRPAYPELGSAELGPDVVFDLDGRLAGAQHTTFHSDEGHTPGERDRPRCEARVHRRRAQPLSARQSLRIPDNRPRRWDRSKIQIGIGEMGREVVSNFKMDRGVVANWEAPEARLRQEVD